MNKAALNIQKKKKPSQLLERKSIQFFFNNVNPKAYLCKLNIACCPKNTSKMWAVYTLRC